MKYLTFSILAVLLLAGCGASPVDPTPLARDLDAAVPADIAEIAVGTFSCTTNADCAENEWCYATADFAACTQR